MKKFLTSIWLIAFFISIPIIYFSLSFFQKYRIDEVWSRTNANPENSNVGFIDLDGDGKKEIVEGFPYNTGNGFIYALQVFSSEGAIYDQYNLKGNYLRFLKFFYNNDCDLDGLKEIYAFSIQTDSLMLSVFEPFGDNKINTFFVTRIRPGTENRFDPAISEGFFYDLNQDGYSEFFFSLNPGYSILPKAIYVFDTRNKTFSHTPVIGNPNYSIHPFNTQAPDSFEIVSGGTAGYNLPDSVKVSIRDRNPYLKVYNKQLEFKFPPVAFPPGISGNADVIPLLTDKGNYYYALYGSISAESPDPILYRISDMGIKIDSVLFPVEQRINVVNLWQMTDGNLAVYCDPDKFNIMNEDLQPLKTIPTTNSSQLYFFSFIDINEDGTNEYLFKDIATGKNYLYTDGFKRKYEFGQDLFIPRDCMVKKNQFYGYSKTKTFIFQFSKNPIRFLFIPYGIGVYFALIGIFLLVRKGQEIRLKEKYELENKVHELQLAMFRNQLHPHFIFNTFNGIASVILQGKKEEAYDIFTRFSSVLRASLKNTEEIFVTLHDELKLVKNFLEIQQFRYKELFEYEITCVPEIDQNQFFIPKMIIQVHVENAIKHGIKPMKKKGLLKISVEEKEPGKTIIAIEDNGRGRLLNEEDSTKGTGLGLKTINQFIKQINRQNKLKIAQKIIDLKGDKGEALGTRIEIIIKSVR